MFKSEISKLFSKGYAWYPEILDAIDNKKIKYLTENELSVKKKIICFHRELENIYQEYYFRKSLNRIRFMLIFGIFVYIFFGIADYILYPEMFLYLWGIRALTLFVVLMLSVYIFAGRRIKIFYFTYILITVFAGVSIAGMMAVVPRAEAQLYYAGIFLVIFFVYTVSGLPFIYSAVAGWLITVFYFLFDLLNIHSETRFLISNMFFITSANIIGMLGGYILEYFIRKDFLLTLKVFLDKKELEKLNSRLRYISNYDELTGLPNRRYIKEFFSRELRRAKREGFPVSVLLIDIDFFKDYNDSYGHIRGDYVLKEVSTVLKKFSRRPTDMAGRWGGEEFLLILSSTNLSTAVKTASDIIKEVNLKNIEHRVSPFGRITVSIGVYSSIPDKKSRYTDFIKEADMALYRAKSSGKNRFYVTGDTLHMQHL
ncbi:diguanylate cyclase [Persephonella atlantica]|uniref:diguanylate cyclase n=1 Tax=Persephonella atlantica TaxID=2699429 RepID=A0ABS1GIV4_9AQUI|nr:diguanylate cyclase [Persephonella atlantica]MBK3332866.1 diguanylate cyclase [Persephonella atlantica]